MSGSSPQLTLHIGATDAEAQAKLRELQQSLQRVETTLAQLGSVAGSSASAASGAFRGLQQNAETLRSAIDSIIARFPALAGEIRAVTAAVGEQTAAITAAQTAARAPGFIHVRPPAPPGPTFAPTPGFIRPQVQELPSVLAARAAQEREREVREALRLNNMRVQAEERAEDVAYRNARAEAEYHNQSIDAAEAKNRAEAEYENQRRRAVEDRQRAEAEYHNQNVDAVRAQQRAEAEYEQANRKAIEDRTRQEAEYINRGVDAAQAKIRAEAEYENQHRGLVYDKQYAEANIANQQIDAAYKRDRALAEYEERDRNLAIAKARRDSEAAARSALLSARERARTGVGIIEGRSPQLAAGEAAARASMAGASAMQIEAAARNAAVAQVERQVVALKAVIAAENAAAAAGASAGEVTAAGARAATIALEEQGRAASHAAGGAGVLGREMRHVVGFFDAISRGQFGQALSSIGAGLRDAGARAGILGVGVGALFAVMAGRHILKSAEDLSRWATEARAAASAAGMSIGAYTQLQGALTLSGLKATEADSALRQMAEHVGEAIADPTSKAAAGFRALGISMDALRATGGDLNKIMDLLSEAWSRSSDGANKSAAAEAALGRGFEQLIPLIQDGVEALEQKRKKAEELGITLDEKTAKSLEQTGQKVNELSATIRGAGIQAMVEWGPHIQSVVGDLEKLISMIQTAIGWIAKLESAISVVTGATAQLSNYLSTTGQQLGHDILAKLGLPDLTAPKPTPAISASSAAAQEARRREREAAEAPKVDISSIVSSAKLREQIALEAADAEAAAAKKALAAHMSTQKAKEAEDRAYIEVLKHHLNDEGVDRDALLKQIAAKELSLTNTQIAEANKRGSANKQETRDYIADIKLRIAEANGNATKIAELYDEEIAKLKQLAAQHKATAAQISEAEREKVQAVNKAKLDQIKETERVESMMTRLQMAGAAASRVGMSTSEQTKAYQDEATMLQQSAARRIAELQTIMETSQEGSNIQKEAAEKILEIITSTKEKEVALYEKADAAYKKSFASLTQVFDQIGSAVESFSGSLFNALIAPTKDVYKIGMTTVTKSERGQEISRAITKLLEDIGNDILKGIENMASKFLAKSIAKLLDVPMEAGTESIGGVLGAKFGKLLGIGGEAPQMAGYTGATSGLTAFTAALTKATAVLTGHSATTTANSAATSTNTGAATANSAATTVNSASTTANSAATGADTVATTTSAASGTTLAGANVANTVATAANTVATTANTGAEGVASAGMIGGAALMFAQGGIVPSAAGGMVVGGLGGTLAILHPQEMVLPANISTGIQSMISRSSSMSNTANLTYSPTVNTSSRSRQGTGMSRSEFTQMLQTHGGSLFGEARNMIRSGWRPAGVERSW